MACHVYISKVSPTYNLKEHQIEFNFSHQIILTWCQKETCECANVCGCLRCRGLVVKVLAFKSKGCRELRKPDLEQAKGVIVKSVETGW